MTLMNVSSHSIKNFLKLFLLPEISTWVILFLRRHSCTLSLSSIVPHIRRNFAAIYVFRLPPLMLWCHVLRAIKSSKNRSNSQQFPVEIQLAIALFRFGHEGNAASVDAIAQWAGVSAGLVVKATRRVMIAVLSLHDSVIRCLQRRKKEEARQWVEQAACNGSCPAWRDGYCMVDGTPVPLFEKPGYHGEAYFDRKSNYSLSVQACYPLLYSLCIAI